MKVELKSIIDQLGDLLYLQENTKVCALVDDTNNTVVGWQLVNVLENGELKPIEGTMANTLKELVENIKNFTKS